MCERFDSETQQSHSSCAGAQNLPNLVTPFWIDDCVLTHRLLDASQNVLHRPFPGPSVKSMEGMLLTTSGIENVKNAQGIECPVRRKVKLLIRATGAVFTNTFSRDHRFLLVPTAEHTSEKVSAAKTWNIPVLHWSWLIDCISKWQFIQPEPYVCPNLSADVCQRAVSPADYFALSNELAESSRPSKESIHPSEDIQMCPLKPIICENATHNHSHDFQSPKTTTSDPKKAKKAVSSSSPSPTERNTKKQKHEDRLVFDLEDSPLPKRPSPSARRKPDIEKASSLKELTANKTKSDENRTPSDSEKKTKVGSPAKPPAALSPVRIFQFCGTGAESSSSSSNNRSICAMVTQLGGRVATSRDFDPGATHVIAKELRRTEKVLCAMAAGKWLLTENYIHDSIAAGHFLPEAGYVWGLKAEHKYHGDKVLHLPNIQRLRELRELRQNGPFAGWTIALVSNPPAIRAVATAGGALVVDFPTISPTSNSKTSSTTDARWSSFLSAFRTLKCVLASEEDARKRPVLETLNSVRRFSKAGPQVVPLLRCTFILDCIALPKMPEMSEYRLDEQ